LKNTETISFGGVVTSNSLPLLPQIPFPLMIAHAHTLTELHAGQTLSQPPVVQPPEETGRIFYPADIRISLKVVLEQLSRETLSKLSEFNNITIAEKKKKTPVKPTKKADPKFLSAVLNTKPLPTDEKERLIQELVDRAVIVGVRNFFNEVDRSDMRLAIIELGPTWHEELNLAVQNNGLPHLDLTNYYKYAASSKDFDPDQVAAYPKSYLRERFRQYFEYLGAETFLTGCSVNTLKEFCQAIELSQDSDDTDPHRNLVDALLEEIFLYGVKDVFLKCKKSLLEKCIEETNVCRLNKSVFCSKGDMINLLLRHEFPHLDDEITNIDELTLPANATSSGEEPTMPARRAGPGRPKGSTKKRNSLDSSQGPPKKRFKSGDQMEEDEEGDEERVKMNEKKRGRPRVSERKDPNRKIEKGVTADYLIANFGQQELADWCKERKIKYYGARAKVVERIIAYLDGNTDGILMDNKRGRKSNTKEIDLNMVPESEQNET
jgi:hypothetical protein